jgi:hypothetical protein
MSMPAGLMSEMGISGELMAVNASDTRVTGIYGAWEDVELSHGASVRRAKENASFGAVPIGQDFDSRKSGHTRQGNPDDLEAHGSG